MSRRTTLATGRVRRRVRRFARWSSLVATLAFVGGCGGDPIATLDDTEPSDTHLAPDAPDDDATPDDTAKPDSDEADAAPSPVAPGFHVVGRELRDANGEPFILRGVNNPHIWWDQGAWEALDDIAATGANAVRVVWETRGDPSRLDAILARVAELGMVPMAELHDVTGSADPDELMRMVGWWTRDDVAPVLRAHRRHLLINIANEWGDWSVDGPTWRDTYRDAITAMRAAGLDHTLVIDGHGWGQAISHILTYGAELLAHDPESNLLFDVHMYGLWNDPELIASELRAAAALELPLVVAEFGYDYNEGINNLFCRVDAPRLLAECEALGVGWLAWSWHGNNAENRWLDLTATWDGDLTPWGELIVDGPHGLRATARRASIFASTPSP